MSMRGQDPEKQDKARRAVMRKLRNARREIVQATERAATLDDLIGMREGHKQEALRLIREIRDEAERAVQVFDDAA